MKNPRVSRRKEIIKIREEISEKERKLLQKSAKGKDISLRRLKKKKKKRQAISQIHQERNGEESIQQIRNENGKITTDNTEIERILRDYYQQLYDSKMDNLEEMDEYSEKYNLPKLN